MLWVEFIYVDWLYTSLFCPGFVHSYTYGVHYRLLYLEGLEF